MKGIGVLFKRNKYKRLCALGEIDSEFSMSHVRRVATPDPWNQIQGSIGRKTSKDQENGLTGTLLVNYSQMMNDRIGLDILKKPVSFGDQEICCAGSAAML